MRRITRIQTSLYALALGAAALAAQAQDAPALQVAEQGTISATLLGTGAANPFTISLIYDTTGGLSVNNPQDRFGGATLFTQGSQVGSSVTIAPTQPIGGQNMSTFPQGTAIQLLLGDGSQFGSTTGGIGKDIRVTPTAQVVFGSNNTATVNFLSGGNFDFSVRLGNVSGAGSGGGCRV